MGRGEAGSDGPLSAVFVAGTVVLEAGAEADGSGAVVSVAGVVAWASAVDGVAPGSSATESSELQAAFVNRATAVRMLRASTAMPR